MPVLDSWYRAEGLRGAGIVQPQSWDQVSANNRLRSNASTDPVQISVLAWYRCSVPRQYRWTTSSQVKCRNRADGRPCLRLYRASTSNPSTALAWYQALSHGKNKYWQIRLTVLDLWRGEHFSEDSISFLWRSLQHHRKKEKMS